MRITTIALRFDSYEDTSLSWLICSTQNAFASKDEAMQSLADYFFAKYKRDTKMVFAECCKKNAKKKDRNFCSDCGADLRKPLFDYDDWKNFLLEMSKASFYKIEFDDDAIWSVFDFSFDVSKENILVVSEDAEHMITVALFKKYPKLENHDLYLGDYFASTDPDNRFMKSYLELIKENDQE